MALRKPVNVPANTEYYYDTHPTHEDLIGDSLPQQNLYHYLLEVLKYFYRLEGWLVAGNFNIYTGTNPLEYPLAPDVMVFKGVKLNEKEQNLRSWKMPQPNRPAPTVVFEIGSDSTYLDDLRVKPEKYAKMGVREYFAYDPHEPRLWRKYGPRLLGWKMVEGEALPLEADERGRLWSEELDSWLAEDGFYLRLYDRDGQLRLTEAEAEQQRAEAERLEKEAERSAKEAAWAKLRELGIDPESL